MIEDELRTLLASRADEVADSPTRVTQVHARIGGIRRRRAVGTALALVLIVAGGVLFIRLPGRPVTLPAGVPAGPYFGDDGRPAPVRGYYGGRYETVRPNAVWSSLEPGFRTVVVARCDRPGDLALRSQPEQRPVEQRLRCRVPVGDHFEGALPLDPGLNDAGLFGVTADGPSSGTWKAGLLVALYPDRLSPGELTGALLDGVGHPAGGSFSVGNPITPPPAHGLAIQVRCVRDVRLEFRVSGRLLTTVACDDDATVRPAGPVSVLVPERTLTAFGLPRTPVVTIEVRSTGRQTDQWAVVG